MLEGGCRRHAQCFLNFLYKLPAVECIQKVDVAGSAAEDFDGQIAAVLPNDIDAWTKEIWENLNEQNKISIYVRFTDLKTGAVENRMINKNV